MKLIKCDECGRYYEEGCEGSAQMGDNLTGTDVTHNVCPKCWKKIKKELGKMGMKFED